MDEMMECQSFGSNYHPSSQSRKVSIGVLVDSIANTKAKNIEQEAEKITPSKRNYIEFGIKGEAFTPILEKYVVAPEQDLSPWVSIRSFKQKVPASVTVKDAEHTPSFPSTCKRHRTSKGSKQVSAVNSVQFSVSKMTALESHEGKQNFGKATYTRKAGKMDVAKHVDTLAFVTVPEVLPDKGLAEGKTSKSETGGTETLRMKLWEILGNVSSPNKECTSSLPVNTGTNDLHQDYESNRKGKPKQNSDTIESDSQKSDHTVRRPFTRSLTLKKFPAKLQSETSTSKFTSYREEYAQKNVSSFNGERSGKLYDTAKGHSLPSKRKSERKSFGVDTNQMCFHECGNSEERQQSDNKRKSIPVAQKSTSAGNNITNNNISHDERNSVYVKPISCNKIFFTNESPLNTTTGQLRDVESPKIKEKDLAYSMLKIRMDPVLDPQSPTFEIKLPIQSSSLGSPPKRNRGEHHDQSPAERIYSTRGIQSFKSFLHSKSTQCKSNAQPELSDNSGELKDSPIMKSRLSLEEAVEKRMSSSSSDEINSESYEENSNIEGCRESELLFPEFCNAKRHEFVSHQSEWLCDQEGVELTGYSHVSKSFKGTEKSRKLQAYSEQNQEDGIIGAIALIAMALDRVKTKINSATSKKVAEILSSAAERIHLQLQSAESQIKTDLGKLNSLSKSKRTSLETGFEEQLEQLHDIYKRFKEAIDQHLVNYKSLIEDLEEHKIELKGIVEKQRTAHNRLLFQGQQAIDHQFKDAQKRITAVHDRAKEKMLQLKLVIAECV